MIARVKAGYTPSLLALASIWGASYFFIKVGVRDFAPTTLMTLRMWIAAVPLFGLLSVSTGVRLAASDIRAATRDGFVLGIINGAFPFTLIAWGEKHIDSGIAAIANSTVPIFVALLALRFRPTERAAGFRLVGILLGLFGVGVLAGVNPEGGLWAVLGTLAVVLASLSYGAGGLYGQWRTAHASGPVLATASLIWGGLVLFPFGLAQLPDHMPGWKPVGSLLALSLLGTALAQLILFRMLRLYGAARTSLVTYLLPVFALFYGGLILDEPVTAASVGGLVLILVGVALGSGVMRPWRSREEAVGTAP